MSYRVMVLLKLGESIFCFQIHFGGVFYSFLNYFVCKLVRLTLYERTAFVNSFDLFFNKDN